VRRIAARSEANVSSNSDQVWRYGHCPLLSVGNESSESCLLLLLMGKKLLQCFKEKCFASVASFSDFVRQTLSIPAFGQWVFYHVALATFC
jgi:hypothetical protein